MMNESYQLPRVSSRAPVALSLAYLLAAFGVGMAAPAISGCGGESSADGPVDAAGSPSDTGDTGGADDVGIIGPIPGAEPTLVYSAQRGVSTPWFVPVGASGAGDPIRLGPRRGAGYGLGEGDVAYPDITPDGQRAVVVFYPMATPSSSGTGNSILFALLLSGDHADAPTRIAEAEQLHALDRAYSQHWVAYVDGRQVRAARLDGSDADDPILVAEAEPGYEIDSLHWAASGEILTYTRRVRSTGAGREAFAATVTERGAGPPVPLLTASGPAEAVAAPLADGRVVVAGPDDRLHAVALIGDAPPIALTPEGYIANYVGASPAGERVVAELRVTWREERQLISAATDGSDGGEPLALTPEPMKSISAIFSRDGSAVAWTAANDAGQWAAFWAPVAPSAASQPARVSDWSSQRLHVTAFDASADALIGSREDGAVLRYPSLAAGPGAPEVLALVDDVANFSIPWPTLSADGAYVLYDANTSSGWQAWVVALSGGDPESLPPPWYRDLLTPLGVIHHEYVAQGALFVSDLEGNRAALTPWHDSAIQGARVADGGRFVVYACDSPAPGFYAAPTMLQHPAASALVVSTDEGELASYHPAAGSPTVVAGHLVRREGEDVVTYALDGSDVGVGKRVARSTKGPVAADTATGHIVVERSGAIVSAPVDASSEPTVIMTLDDRQVAHLSILPGSASAIVALTAPSGDSELYLVAVDGSDASAPRRLAGELPGWFMSVGYSATGAHLFSVHSVEATAVPHPDVLLAVPTGHAGSEATGAAYALAPKGYMLWGTGDPFESGGSLPTTSADGLHTVLSGPDGLYAARTDGSDAAEPRWLGSATQPFGAALSPDGNRLLLREDQIVVATRIDGTGTQRQVTNGREGVIGEAAWTSDGERIVYGTAPDPSYTDRTVLRVVASEASAASGTALHPPSFTTARLAMLSSEWNAAVVESTVGGDRSLYLVSLDPANAADMPAAISPVDDVGERFVGIVPTR